MANSALAHFDGWSDDQYRALTERLARHAVKWLTRYGLMAGDARIPGGKGVEDVVADSIAAVVTARRLWDPARHPDLEAFLKMVIVSEIRNIFKAKERWLVVPLLLPEEAEAQTALEVTANPSAVGNELITVEPDPAVAFEREERRIRITLLINLLRAEIDASVRNQADRDDMEYILMALEEEHETPAEIEQATSIPRDRIYRLLERMRALATRVLKQLPNDERK
jgi:hypothetical protein